MKIFKRTIKQKAETPASEPGYYKNLNEMIFNFKTMLSQKDIPYIFNGLDSPLFNGLDYNTLTAENKEAVKLLIDDIIQQINFLNYNPCNITDTAPETLASTELILMCARVFQDMPLYGQITIH